MAAAALVICGLLSVAIFSFSKMQTLPWASELRDPSISVAYRKNLPNFQVDNNNLLRPETLIGQWTLISFWSVTCPPCLQELPAMNQLALNWQGPPFQIITVNLDHDRPEDLESAHKFLQEQDISLPTIFDRNSRLKTDFSVNEYPKHFLVNPNGQIVWEERGSFAWNGTAAKDQLLKLMEKELPDPISETAE